MAISPLGNVVIVNQMTPAATSMQNSYTNRVDIQNMAAQVAANEKKQEIEEVRPAEENHAIDPDREHNQQEADEKMQQEENLKQHATQEEQEEAHPLHKLDIKV